MANDLIVDLDAIDLDAVYASVEEVGRINPQCGDMRQLDHVIWMDDERQFAVGVKHVREDEFWVPLHIPGRPLLPGVLMIEAAAQLSSVHYHYRADSDRFLGFTRCDDTVFRGQVLPGDTLYLISEALLCKPRRSICRTQGVVNGQLVFESKITGMTL